MLRTVHNLFWEVPRIGHYTLTVVQQRVNDWNPPHSFWYSAVFRNDFAFNGKPLILSTRWSIFYAGGATRSLWRHQQWSPSLPPSWILPRIGHFRVPKTLSFKMRLGAQPFLWKWVLFVWEWKMVSISKAEHLPSFWNRGPGELRNGLLEITVKPEKMLIFCAWHNT